MRRPRLSAARAWTAALLIASAASYGPSAPTGAAGAGTSRAAGVQAVPAQQEQTPAADLVERPPILGIAHVAFRVSALAEARTFYGEVLGLEQVRQDPATDRARFRLNERQAIILEPGLSVDEDERLSHLAFETSDLARLAAYLKAHGVMAETAEASTSRCASHALWVKDPDGHPIEFVTRQATGTAGQARSPQAPSAQQGVRAVAARALHAGLTVRDAEAADRFYETILGFSEIWRGGRTDSTTSWINMKVPDGTDYLEYMLISEPVSRRQLGVLHHVALLVPDIQAAYETVLARTPPTERPMASPQVGRNNRWQLNLYDPDGTRVELMEPFTTR